MNNKVKNKEIVIQVYALTRRYKTNAHYVKNRFILCPVWRGLPILRDKNSKWGVSYEEIPRDEKYPVSGI